MVSCTEGSPTKHGLEAPLEGRVLLDVLAVLVEGGGADAVELPSRQGWLEHVAGVHRALGLAGADDGVHLVDEENDLSLGGGDLLEHRLEPLLELTAELGAGHHGAQVERDQALALEALGHVAVDDPPRQALGDGRLADAGLADQHRVVLRSPRQHLDRSANLLVTADDRIELAGPSELGEILPVLLERPVGPLRVLARHPVRPPDVLQGGEHSILAHPRGLEHLSRAAPCPARGR